MNVSEWVAIITSVLATIVSIVALYWSRQDKRDSKVEEEIRDNIGKLERHERECTKTVGDLVTKVEVTASRVETLWNVVMKRLADILISPHTPLLDPLLAKFRDGKLDEQEKPELIRLLKERIEEDKVKDKGRAFLETLILVRLESGH